MKLLPELIDKEAHKEFRRFLENTGHTNWEEKIKKLNSLPRFRAPSPNVYLEYLANRNPLAKHIEIYLTLEREGKSLRKHASPALMKACGSLQVVNAIFRESDRNIREKLKSILFDDDTAKAFMFELDIATHFFQRGYDVRFVDLQGIGTFDLLVSSDQWECEVECKTKSADAGRKITRSNFALLCDVLSADLPPLTESMAVLIKCDGRLSGNQEFFHAVAAEIKKCRIALRDSGQIESVGFQIKKLSSGLQIRTHEDAAKTLAAHWTPNAHYFVLSNAETLVIGCESTDKNRVLKAIYEDLRHGAGQLSKTRPSMLACQLGDIQDEDWNSLQGETGLAAMSGRLLGSPERRHVNRVVYSSDQTMPKKEGPVMSFSATNLTFESKEPKYPLPQSFFSRRSEHPNSKTS